MLCLNTGIAMRGSKDTASADGEVLAEALYDENKEDLQSYVRKRLPAADIAYTEDIVQEAFARTIKRLNNGNPVRSPKALLYKTARNVITSTTYRRREYIATDATDDRDGHAAESSSCSARQRLDALEMALSSLPDNYREAFERRRIKGESNREIAKTMGIAEHEVSTYVALGWQLLVEYCEAHDIVLEELPKP